MFCALRLSHFMILDSMFNKGYKLLLCNIISKKIIFGIIIKNIFCSYLIDNVTINFMIHLINFFEKLFFLIKY